MPFEGWITWAAEALVVIYLATAGVTVLLERRRPAATLAWLLALVFLPFVGLFLYFLFGRRRVRRVRKRRARAAVLPIEATVQMANIEDSPHNLAPHVQTLVKLALASAAAPLRRADAVHVEPDAEAAFNALLQGVAEAQHRIHAQFYIWRDDEAGKEMVDALAARAREGVVVRVLVDDLGSMATGRAHFKPLIDAGGTVSRFGRLRLRMPRRSRLNFRNHRKILCVDGRVGFCGGLNVGQEYRGTDARGKEWNDLLVRLEGDAVLGLEAVFLDDWLAATGQLVEPTAGLPGPSTSIAAKTLPDTPVRSTGALVQIIPSGPDLAVASVIAAQFVSAIALALERCWIVTPYFVPDSALALMLRTAALRGVDVRLLVPNAADNDSRLVGLAARSYYDELLEAGCRIFEFRSGMLHAKYLVIDECVAAIGSANMDIRSLHINYEVTAMFYDAAISRSLADAFVDDLRGAREVTAQQRAGMGLVPRLTEAIARLLSPIL